MAKKAAKGAAAKKKRTVSGNGASRAERTIRATDPRGVVGIAVFCLGLLALLCQFIPSNGGFLNRCMLIVRGLGGMLCLLLPVVLCWAGVVLVFFGEKKAEHKNADSQLADFSVCGSHVPAVPHFRRERGAGGGRRGRRATARFWRARLR